MRPLGNIVSAGATTGTVLTGLAASGGAKLPVLAFSLASVQALLIDELDGALFRYLDLPLAVVIAVALTRPAAAVVTGFVVGLAVDSFQLRFFGLHGLAYCILGPLAAGLPIGSLRRRSEIVASLATAQCLAASTIVIGGAALADRALPPDLFAHVVQVTLWSVVIVLPLTSLLGGRMGLATPEPLERGLAATSADWR